MPSSPLNPANPSPPKLTNLYNLRQVATAKPCFICSKETNHCLANNEMTDWMFVCFGHVLDPAFAKPVPATSSTPPLTPSSSAPSSPAPVPVPQSEIDKVKLEYEEKQKRKIEKEAAATTTTTTKEKETPSSSTGKAFSVLKSSVSTLTSLATTATTQSASVLFPPPQPVIPSPSELLKQQASTSKTFVLNRDYFDMRVQRKKKEWQVRDAKERSKEWNFPKVPRGGLPSLP
ncbi:hypothetical protein JCM16303_004732 [Sporobolomyces ruberrimus]